MDSLLKDIKENEPAKAPSLPQPAQSGFPAPKKRVSAFKALRRGNPNNAHLQNHSTIVHNQKAPPNIQPSSKESVERQQINEENNARIASMSPDEIARARDELMNNLTPNLIELLMKRADIGKDGDEQSAVFDRLGSPSETAVPLTMPPEIKIEDISTTNNAMQSVLPSKQSPASLTSRQARASEPNHELNLDDRAPEKPVNIEFVPDRTHYPKADDIPELNPDDPDFFVSMQQKYFPNLTTDPKQLSWMAPIPTEHSPADRDSPYYPGQSSLPISALRFDFRGRLISPKKSREIPITKGLHHHGEAPEAAGYTIGELGIYARSAVPGQRCIAFQTLGRLLYRLGQGQWGKAELAQGIWASIMENRVMDSLLEAAAKQGGHLSSQTYATEALWLYEQGGWNPQYQGI